MNKDMKMLRNDTTALREVELLVRIVLVYSV